jgi:hypothetical protein
VLVNPYAFRGSLLCVGRFGEDGEEAGYGKSGSRYHARARTRCHGCPSKLPFVASITHACTFEEFVHPGSATRESIGEAGILRVPFDHRDDDALDLALLLMSAAVSAIRKPPRL